MSGEVDRPRRRTGWWLAVAGILSVVAGLSVAAPAAAAAGTVSTITLVTTSDGTAPFDADNAPGNDSGPNNGIVRTSDFVSYQWQYGVSVAGDLTFVQTLPATMAWDASSTVLCVEGAAAISADRHTLTCTIAGAATGAGAYSVRAKVLGAADGANLSTSVTSGSVASNTVSVTASAVTRANVAVYPVTASASPGMGANAGVPGFLAIMGVDMFMPIDPGKGVRGLQSLASPITYRVDLPATPAGLELFSCAATQASAISPGPSGGGNNAVIDSGTLNCAQPGGPGTPVTATLTGANSTVDTFPTQNKGGGALAPDRAYFAVGSVAIWAPETSFPIGGLTAWTQQLAGFDPNGVDGSSNYGAGFAPGQDPGAACVTTPVANCASFSVNRIQIASVVGAMVSPGTYAPGQSVSTAPLPGSSGSTAGDAPLYPAQRYNLGSIAITGGGNSPLADFAQCTVWYPGLQQIESGRVAFGELNSVVQPTADYTIEYGNAVYADDDARRAATGACGTAGDGASGWFGSVAAAGGPTAVSAVRLRWLNPITASTNARLWVPMTRAATALPSGSPVPMFTSRSGDGLPVVASPYNPATNSGAGGTRGLAWGAQVRNTVTWDAAGGEPGAPRTITVTPTVTNPFDPGSAAVASAVVVQVSLPNPCVAYQQGSATPAPVVVTPPDLGPDGIACTADDGAGAVLQFALGDLTAGTPVPPIVFTVNLDPTTPVPSTQVVTSIVSSPSDGARAVDRTATASLVVNALASFDITKTASAAFAAPGIPFTYTIGWANRLPVTAGMASFVDVLPFNGDTRGTTGLGRLDLLSVTPRDATTTVQYTTDQATAVETAIAGDPSGSTGITWTSSAPASGATALRFLTGELVPGSVGSIDVRVVPDALSRTGEVVNDISGTTSGLGLPVQGAAKVALPSEAAELSGNAYHDLDFSFSRTAGDVGLPGLTVELTGYSFGPNLIDDGGKGDDIPLTNPIVATTDASGNFLFPGVAPGVYTLTMVPPAGMVAAEVPAMPITARPGEVLGGILFGFQDIPIVTLNPVDQTVVEGRTATFTAAASSSVPPTVRWQVSTDGGATWTNVAGGTLTTSSATAFLAPTDPTSTLTVPSTTISQSGNRYRAVFTNAVGSTDTSAATLTVTTPAATQPPASGEANADNDGLAGTGSNSPSDGITVLSFLLLFAGSALISIGRRRWTRVDGTPLIPNDRLRGAGARRVGSWNSQQGKEHV